MSTDLRFVLPGLGSGEAASAGARSCCVSADPGAGEAASAVARRCSVSAGLRFVLPAAKPRPLGGAA